MNYRYYKSLPYVKPELHEDTHKFYGISYIVNGVAGQTVGHIFQRWTHEFSISPYSCEYIIRVNGEMVKPDYTLRYGDWLYILPVGD